MSSHTLGQGLATQLNFTAYTTQSNVADISHEESLRTPAGGGNSMNWVLGHMLDARNSTLKLIGKTPSLDTGDIYKRNGPEFDAAAAAPFEELVQAFGATQETLVGFLESANADALAKEIPNMPSPLGDTLGSAVTAIAFHEAYHSGQLGILRRCLGKDGVLK